MAFNAVVGSFEIASTVATVAGMGQSHLYNKNNQICQISDSLSKTHSNLLSAFDGLSVFANILTDEESRTFSDACGIVKEKLQKYVETPIPKKKRLFWKTQEYKDYLSRIRGLETTASNLLLEVKQVSSKAAINKARLERAHEQDCAARETRQNILEDIRYQKGIEQFGPATFPDLSAMRESIEQEAQSTNESGLISLQQDPFLDEALTAWAEHRPL